MKWKQLGNFNEILTDDIGDGTRIANFCFIGKDVKIGKNVKIGNFCEINRGTVIGDNCVINPYCVFNDNTIIGHDTIFGGQVMTADEKYMSTDLSKIVRTPCKIGSYVKVGQGARLVCCDIGDHAIIGTAAVVMNDIPKKEVWIGTPAKKLRDINDIELKL
jgi:acetyltransferase-like isoleucine patch superfamily enzyme